MSQFMELDAKTKKFKITFDRDCSADDERKDPIWFTPIEKELRTKFAEDWMANCKAESNKKMKRCSDWMIDLGSSEHRVCLIWNSYCSNEYELLIQLGKWTLDSLHDLTQGFVTTMKNGGVKGRVIPKFHLVFE